MKKHNWTDITIVFGSLIAFNIIIPVLDGLANMAISNINKTINKWQIDMQLDQAEGQAAAEVISPAPSVTQAIGFQIPNEEENYDE